MSRLVAWSDRVLEAGSLLVLPAAVLYFSTHSARGFEPDKILLVRSFMIVMAAAWLIRTFDSEGLLASLKRWRPDWITLAVLGVAGTGVVSWACSLEPLLSWQGSYLRAEGLATTLTFLGFYGCVRTALRSRAQAERLITSCLLPLPAVCAYATLQRLGFDPLWGDITVTRVGSTSGNAVALGAYLITVVPLLVHRLAGLLAQRPVPRGAVAGHVALLAWIAVTMIWTAARGPTVGLAVALMLVGWVTLRRSPRQSLGLADALKALAAVVVSLAVGAGVFWAVARLLGVHEPHASFAACLAACFCLGGVVVLGLASGRAPAWGRLVLLWLAGAVLIGASVLNLPSERAQTVLPGPAFRALEQWRTIPWVWRFSRLLDAGKSTGKVRTLLWEGALMQLERGCAVAYPGGATDQLRSFRLLVGWGQETQSLTFPQFYPPELAYLESADQRVDRLHNQTLDLLITQGLLGLAAWHALFLAGLMTCLRGLGFALGWRHVLAWFVGGAAAAGAVVALGAPIWLGLAFPVGALLSFGCSLPASARPVEPWAASVSLACLAVLAGHLVEVQVGFGLVPSTMQLFLALALCARASALEEGEPNTRVWEAPVLGLALALVCLALLSPINYMAQIHSSDQVPSVLILLQNFLWGSHQTRTFDNPAGLTWVLAAWWGGVGLALAVRARPLGWGRLASLVLGPPGLAFAAVLALARPLRQAYFWLWMSSSTIHVADAVDVQTSSFIVLLLIYWLVWGLALLWLVLALPSPRGSRDYVGRPESRYFAPLVAALALLSVWSWALRPAVADTLYAQVQNMQKAQAEAARAAEGWLLPVATLEQCVALAPRVDMYVSFLGEYLGRQATLTEEPGDRQDLRTQARRQMVRARDLSPLEPNNASNVGLVSLELARLLPADDPRREQLLREAREEYTRALLLSPSNVPLMVEVGNRLVEDYRDLEAAENLLRKAIQLDPRYFGAYYSLASVLEWRARSLPPGSRDSRRLLAASAATALAGTRFEPAGPSRDAHWKVMVALHEAAGLRPPSPR